MRRLDCGVGCERAGHELGRARCRGVPETLFFNHHSKGGRGSAYTVTPGNYTDRLVLKLPAGTYQVDWVAPETGSVIRTDTSTHKGGYRTVETPAYSVDIALRIKRVSKPAPSRDVRGRHPGNRGWGSVRANTFR